MSEYTNLVPKLTQEDYAALRADIKKANRVLVPVEYDELGNILDGYHRVQICKELGITEWPRIVREGLTEEEKRAHARRLNLARRHLTAAQKRELIEAQLKETPDLSDRQIGVALNVNHETVGATRERLIATGEIRRLEKTKGADGKTRSRKTKTNGAGKTKPRKKFKATTPIGVPTIATPITQQTRLQLVTLQTLIDRGERPSEEERSTLERAVRLIETYLTGAMVYENRRRNDNAEHRIESIGPQREQ